MPLSFGKIIWEMNQEGPDLRARLARARAEALEQLPLDLRPYADVGDVPHEPEPAPEAANLLLTPEDIMKIARVETRRAAISLMRHAGAVRIGEDWRIANETWRTWWLNRSATESIYTARNGGHAIRSQMAEKSRQVSAERRRKKQASGSPNESDSLEIQPTQPRRSLAWSRRSPR